ncbi:ParB/RepB/Spo0J family partition protein [Sphingomonas sabuli]|uniref:ParB/RepB/Spo0J family partition protein n=1 Tax=Sphingomonas sabuli TaxID=2764186 RepID=A0A7G9L080_9SPHN|nr:ParB/RepB/Spo0J family partition protein [Sphingomonas sabuli]QNM82029.1 ParB/RepB/Spo0J family partition protein [Sphingomonas sabuli]
MAILSSPPRRTRSLKQINPIDISENPENPRLIFRKEEMESLLRSIDQYGIQVPVTVYEEHGKFRLLDGERRWRCALTLGLKAVPAIVQNKPSELQNLVLMYNIHALREQWDYFTIASKLERIIELWTLEHDRQPNERDQSELTGLSIGAIRRCQLLIGLPGRFKSLLMEELEKPKSQQKLSEDFFIEMERSLKTVTRRLPEYEEDLDRIRDTLIEKFRDGKIAAITDFRQLSKIATAIEGLGVAQRTAKAALDKVFNPRHAFGIKEAYAHTVEFEYFERKASREVDNLSDFIDVVLEERRFDELDDEFVKDLRLLSERLEALLKALP